MSSNTSSLFTEMPADILVEIFERIPELKPLFALPQVCKDWKDVTANNPSIWSFVKLPMPSISESEKEAVWLLKHSLERSKQHPLTIIANFKGGASRLDAGDLKNEIRDRARQVGNFRTLVVSENDNGVLNTSLPFTQAYDIAFSAKVGDKRLPKIWVHTNWEGDSQVLNAGVDHIAACLEGLGLNLAELGLTDDESFISVHTSGYRDEGKNLSLTFLATAWADWNKLTTLSIHVPGCSHQYP